MGKNLKNILLIGGLGFLGGRIAKYLSEFNYSITITTQKPIRKIPREYQKNIEIKSFSNNSESQLNEVFKEIDCLIYLICPDAHSDGRLGSNKISDYSSFSRRVVKYAELNGIRKIIYFSTVHVYE